MREINSHRKTVPRMIPEGVVPLIAVEGTAYECGRWYAELVLKKYPGYRKYLDQAKIWKRLPAHTKRLFQKHAPYVLDIYAGILNMKGKEDQLPPAPAMDSCTSFGVSGSITLDGAPISGQTKDTGISSALLYIVLRMRIKDGPAILVLAYPGEVLGYGMWSTGMSIFRNALFSMKGSETGLSMEEWGFLTLAGKSVHEGAELAKKFGIKGTGNCLISDPQGESLSVEFNQGGVSVVPAKNGIATHANHPVGSATAPFEHYPSKIEKQNSRYRMHGLWELLYSEQGRLTPQKALMCLANHAHYPRGICRHIISKDSKEQTTAAVIAEPTRGKLHVVRGNPCCNWPTTYAIE